MAHKPPASFAVRPNLNRNAAGTKPASRPISTRKSLCARRPAHRPATNSPSFRFPQNTVQMRVLERVCPALVSRSPHFSRVPGPRFLNQLHPRLLKASPPIAISSPDRQFQPECIHIKQNALSKVLSIPHKRQIPLKLPCEGGNHNIMRQHPPSFLHLSIKCPQ